jgi:hypothetical protein
MLDETYWTARGGGAYLNHERLHVSAIESINACSFNPNGLREPAVLLVYSPERQNPAFFQFLVDVNEDRRL